MSEYRRHAFLTGNTDNPTVSRPLIRGVASPSLDATGNITGITLPFELVLETETTSGPVSVIMTDSTNLYDLVDQINTALSGDAEAWVSEGGLHVASMGVGEGSFVRVHQDLSLANNVAPLLGLPMHPHPLATVRAGDLLDAPVRPTGQLNPVGTKFLALGEDRVSSSFNRALMQMGVNSDSLYTWLRTPVPAILEIEIEEGTHAGYYETDADGAVLQVNLSDLSVFSSVDPSSRVYVGELTNTSSLRDIAKYFAVTDSRGIALMGGSSRVHVGAVTRGQRTLAVPTFTNPRSAPSIGTELANSAATSPDGLNALGTDRVKASGETITAVPDKSTIVCAGATFLSDGVREGDKAVITGAGVNTPFSHDGTYLVDTVVDETTLVLRPHHEAGTVRFLNQAGTGPFGDVTVSAGDWDEDIWVSFLPRIVRFPEDGVLRLLVPVETSMAALLVDALVGEGIRGPHDISGWVSETVLSRLSLEGAYQGLSEGEGGGAIARIDHRPATFVSDRDEPGSRGTLDRSGAGEVTPDLMLVGGAAVSFTHDDLGKVVELTGSGFLDAEPWTIAEVVDGRTVRLSPPSWRLGWSPGSAVSVTWDMYEDSKTDFPSLMMFETSESHATLRSGLASVRDIFGASSDDKDPAAFPYVHLERVKLVNDGGSLVDATGLVAATVAGDSLTTPSIDLQETLQVFAKGGVTDVKQSLANGGGTFLRILHGPSRGWYQVRSILSAAMAGDNTVQVLNLDGTVPTMPSQTDVSFALYTATVALHVPFGDPALAGTMEGQVALSVMPATSNDDISVGIRVGPWRGQGLGFVMELDIGQSFLDMGDHGAGSAFWVDIGAPIQGGHIRARGRQGPATEERTTHALELSAVSYAHTETIGTTVTGFGVRVHQGGSDPALIVSKTEDDSFSLDLTSGKVSPSAASILHSDRDVKGRGGAVEQVGSTWIYRGYGDSLGSGLFVDDVVGAGRWLYPMAGLYAPIPYAGSGPTDLGWNEPTRLGSPGVVWPMADAVTSTPGGLLEPSTGEFNMTHAGIMVIANLASVFAPISRLVGNRVLITQSGHRLENEEFVIQAVKVNLNGEVLMCLFSETEVVGSADEGSTLFRILGQRWHKAHLNIADYAMIGTGLSNFAGRNLPMLTVLNSPVEEFYAGEWPTHDEYVGPQRALTRWVWTSSREGARLGFDLAMGSLVRDATAAGFMGGYAWSAEQAAGFVSHPWADEAKAPTGPFNALTFSSETGQSIVRTGSPPDWGTVISDDFAITILDPVISEGEVSWDEDWGGSLKVSVFSEPHTIRVWQRGRSLCLSAHQAVKVNLLLAASYSDASPVLATVALRRPNGTAVAQGTIEIPQDTPARMRSRTITLTLNDTNALLRGSSASAAGLVVENLSVTVDFPLLQPGSDLQEVWIGEWHTEDATLPAVMSGSLAVLGTSAAHVYRFVDPVHGADTRGPLDAFMLNNLDYGRNWSHHLEPVTGAPKSPTYGTGMQERRHTPGAIRVQSGIQSAPDRWFVPGIDPYVSFNKGINSTAIRLYNGAYDPVWYLHYSQSSTKSEDTDFSLFIEPGFTGFCVPFDPPHGAVLTTLALNLSFLPFVQPDPGNPGDKLTEWCIYRGWDGFHWAGSSAGSGPTIARMMDTAGWRAREGVTVRLWRHAIAPTAFEQGPNANWNQVLPESSYSEQIASWEIDLSGVTPPEVETNPRNIGSVDPFTYAGTEHYELRNWDILKAVDDTNSQLLRVDRTQYVYFMTIEFWGGPREESGGQYQTFVPVELADGHGLAVERESPGFLTPGGGGDTGGWLGYYTTEPYSATADSSFPPTVKFRGARLGYLTDRPGHGGWGG